MVRRLYIFPEHR